MRRGAFGQPPRRGRRRVVQRRRPERLELVERVLQVADLGGERLPLVQPVSKVNSPSSSSPSRSCARIESYACRAIATWTDPHASAHVDEERHADRRPPVRTERQNRPRLPVVPHLEVRRGQTRQRTAALVADRRLDTDEVDSASKRRARPDRPAIEHEDTPRTGLTAKADAARDLPSDDDIPVTRFG